MRYEKREEKIISDLSLLYKTHGFKRYKPSCFEEFSLYQENKDFLIGKNVITFSDLNGKLLAMRPDVTLSLVKHVDVEAGGTEKFFYNEKVYRQAAASRDYKEISQTGVEVVGAIDEAVVAEIAVLICRTLATVDENYILDISHMGFIEGLLGEFDGDSQLLGKYLKTKNLHDFYKLAEKKGYSDRQIKAFEASVNACGDAEKVLKAVKEVVLCKQMQDAVEELESLVRILKMFGIADKVNINFSAFGNADYYNGVIFNGYLKGIPHYVLSGGRYDKLLQKLGKSGGALGFALYLGEIERYLAKDDETCDYLVVYDKKTQIKALEFAENAIKSGAAVRISTSKTVKGTFRKTVDMTCAEAKND